MSEKYKSMLGSPYDNRKGDYHKLFGRRKGLFTYQRSPAMSGSKRLSLCFIQLSVCKMSGTKIPRLNVVTRNFAFQFWGVNSPDEVVGAVFWLSTATSQTTQFLISYF